MTKETREMLGLSQRMMARYLGITRSQFSMIESGWRNPNHKTLVGIVRLDRLCNEALLKARDNNASADFLKKDDGSYMKTVTTEMRNHELKLAITKRSIERLTAKQNKVSARIEVLNNLSISTSKKDELLSLAKQITVILHRNNKQTLLKLNTQLCGLEAMLAFLKAQE